MRTRLALALMFLIAACATDSKDKEENYFKITRGKEKECVGPYGPIAHGKSIKMYNVLITEGSEKCKSEVRKCTDGELTGSFIFPGCTEVATAK